MIRWEKLSLRVAGTVLLGLGAMLAVWLAFSRLSMGAAVLPVSAQASGDPSADLLISAVHTGLSGFGGKDEAFRLTNILTTQMVLTNTWGAMDKNGRMIYFPTTGITLAPGAGIWCACNALSFTLAFGFAPSLEYCDNSTPAVPDMSLASGFAFADSGGVLVLFQTVLVDTANGDGGNWPAGANTFTNKASMERRDPTLPDTDANWDTSTTTAGIDVGGNPITGTPQYTNSAYAGSGASSAPAVAINEIAWMGTISDTNDEWMELYNNTDRDIDLNGWLLTAVDGTPSVQLTGAIPAHGFYLLERTDDTAVKDKAADQIYTGVLENSNESLRLYQNYIIDVLVYGNADSTRLGWSGPALQPYAQGSISASGQVLFRKRSESTGLPLPDTNTAADWANNAMPGAVLYGPVHEGDLWGKRAQYPGWDWDAYTNAFEITATAGLTVAIAPDNMYTPVASLLSGASQSILIESYTFESIWLTDILTERIHAGVQVTMLLEGMPTGGLPDQELWNAQRIATAGGHVYFMHNDDVSRIHDRYDDLHAKFIVVDGKQVAVLSENLGNHAMPVDDKSNGTAGNRGVALITDQPQVIAYIESLFAHDCDLAHADIVPYGALLRYTVPFAYTPVYSPGGGYEYLAPFSVAAPAFTADYFEIVHSPETSLRYADGLIGLVRRAGPGDEVYVEQMYERVHWGASSSTPAADPNPRLEAYIQAARQGASVRILLDKGFDDTLQNRDTAFYLYNIAQAEGLDLQVRWGNPTCRGIHNKMVLVKLGSDKYIHVGSINGSETSSKVNRELALQVRSGGAFDYLKSVFDYDWANSSGPYQTYLPVIFREYVPPSNHVLISEVAFNPPGADDLSEWVELYNPTTSAIDMSGWLLGDAAYAADYERLYIFPAGTTIPAGGTLVIARQAAAYQALNYPGKPVPDFELNNSNDVPDLAVSGWGAGEFALGNAGDEVLLFEFAFKPVDVLVYGTGSYPGVASFGDISGLYSGSSLERWPANRDTDDCARDLRAQYAPRPGSAEAW